MKLLPIPKYLILVPLCSFVCVGALLYYGLVHDHPDDRPVKSTLGVAVPLNLTPLSTFTRSREEYIDLPEKHASITSYTGAGALVDNVSYTLDVAQSFPQRTLGLSYRRSLCDTCGMLFIFDYSERHGIWMKDMFIDLDILWLDKHYHVVHMEKNVSPDTFPQVFYPPSPARYVIELPAGSIPPSFEN